MKIFKIIIPIIILIIVIYFIYKLIFPSSSYIFNCNQYVFMNEYNNEQFNYTFYPNEFLFKNNESIINLSIAERHDSTIIVEKIMRYKDEVNIVINSKTQWRFKNGKCLTNYQINSDGSVSTVMKNIMLLNSDGKEIPYNQYSTESDRLFISFGKELLNSNDKFILTFQGFNVLTYKRK